MERTGSTSLHIVVQASKHLSLHQAKSNYKANKQAITNQHCFTPVKKTQIPKQAITNKIKNANKKLSFHKAKTQTQK